MVLAEPPHHARSNHTARRRYDNRKRWNRREETATNKKQQSVTGTGAGSRQQMKQKGGGRRRQKECVRSSGADASLNRPNNTVDGRSWAGLTTPGTDRPCNQAPPPLPGTFYHLATPWQPHRLAGDLAWGVPLVRTLGVPACGNWDDGLCVLQDAP